MEKIILSLILGIALVWPSGKVLAQGEDVRSHRSSLCSIMIKHTEDEYADPIEKQFLQIPVDDKFNDHNLAVRVTSVSDKDVEDADVDGFIERNKVASRLVARWFNRNKLTGECNLNMVRSRGFYDASAMDYEIASRSRLGQNIIADAGEELIGHTYLLMHEITYIDKGKRSSFWGGVVGAALTIGTSVAGLDDDLASDIGAIGNLTVSSLKGFRVKIHSRLYRLVWDKETSDLFFSSHYWEPGMASDGHRFDAERDKYRLEYVGDIVSKGGSTSFLGINEDRPELMIRKACARALEENVADLQKAFPQFRIKTPLTSTAPAITAGIGLKEGVTAKSRFEVLECQEKDGITTYKRVGVIKPIPNMIWDNRFMATEEGAETARLGATSFTKESGGDFYPGMLIREM